MEPVIKLELSVAEVNMILAGLAELPFKASSDVIQKIRASAMAQMAQPPQPSKEED